MATHPYCVNDMITAKPVTPDNALSHNIVITEFDALHLAGCFDNENNYFNKIKWKECNFLDVSKTQREDDIIALETIQKECFQKVSEIPDNTQEDTREMRRQLIPRRTIICYF